MKTKSVIRTFLALSTILLSGCVTLGSTGWIAAHSLEIGQVALVAGAANQVISLSKNVESVVETEKK